MGYYGELAPRTSMRGYWKLEDENDSSGNGATLTNNGSVAFSVGKFNKGADFGTSGTGKSLYTNTSPFSAVRIANITASVWIKLNTTANDSNTARIIVWNTVNATTSGMSSIITYTIAGGVWTIKFVTILSGGNTVVTYSLPPDAKWHSIFFVKSNTTTNSIYFDGVFVNSTTGSGTDNSQIAGPSIRYLIGQDLGLSANVTPKAIIDEVIVEERAWSPQEIRKYYAQATGRLAPRIS